MSYQKPAVLVYQEFATIPTEVTQPLRAHISGPNADLHRYTDADEKPNIAVGAYDYLADAVHTWPGRSAGGLVDQDYTKVFVDDALLLYLEDVIGADSLITPVANRSNRIQSSTLNFKTNGTAYPRSAVFKDRDVALGDTVYLRCVSPDDDCDEIELWTYVTGFASAEIDSIVAAATAEEDNQEDESAEIAIEKTGGPDNCISAEVVDPSDYDGRADGDITEQYTIEVVKSSVPGCSAARLRITSASGHDDADEVEPADFGEETAIGTRGVAVIFSDDAFGSCSVDAEDASVTPNALIVGQKWVVTVTQDFEAPEMTSGGEYTGPDNDVYIVEVSKGGAYGDLPTVTVSTVKGLDFSGPTEITDEDVDVPIGRYGVTVSFNGADGLRKGDKYYVTVTAAAAGPVRQLILKHGLPAGMLTAEDLDLRLYIKANIELLENRTDDAPLVNWEQETTQITLKAGATAFHSSYTLAGVQQSLEVRGGTVYIHYREWLTALTDAVGSINDVADLDEIPGPLDRDNPLKWGVSRALAKSNGTYVKYTAVADPTDLDDWQAVLARIKGADALYNLVPLTFTRDVQNLYAAHIEAESNPEDGNWKGGFFGIQAVTNKAIVSIATSTDEEVVLATLKDNPSATGTQYTLLQVPEANGQFITNNVQAGDTVRVLYTTDGFGNVSYSSFVVDEVLSEDALILLSGHTVAINAAQKVEIWHALSKDEIAANVASQAGSFASRRICAVWPDEAGSGGTTEPGYFVAAALAGEVSGVAPQQGLTNVELTGYDDMSRSAEFFNSTQLDVMSAAGVWIVTQAPDGTVYTRHGLTTDNTDLNRREEMIRRNFDSISYFFLNRLKPFIGRTNATEAMLDRLRYEVETGFTVLENSGLTTELGGQLRPGSTIRVLQIHQLLKDRIEIVLDLVLPAPLNNIELHLVA